MFYDAHLHNTNEEIGGFLVGLEGKPFFEGTLTNEEVLKIASQNENYIAFYYVPKEEVSSKVKHNLLKYHPRREKYSPEDVINSIKINKPDCVMIDTLNEPFWDSKDYWNIVLNFPDIPFILPHSGGYLINDFIKICHFQKNVWIDFSLTHTNLGKFDNPTGLFYIQNAINYALNGCFRNRILLGSDYPFFMQEKVFEYYKDYEELLNNNFIELRRAINANKNN